MSLTNRSETRLLVENWRKVLEEGLHDKDPELLEEGALGEKLVIASLLVQGLFGIVPASARTLTPDTTPTKEVVKMAKKQGQRIFDDSLYTLNKKKIQQQVFQCFVNTSNQVQTYISQNQNLTNWFENVAIIHKNHDIYRTTGVEGAELAEKFADKIAQNICLNFYRKVILLTPVLKPGIDLINQKDKEKYAVAIIGALLSKQTPTEQMAVDALEVVQGTFTHGEAFAKVLDVASNAGAKRVFGYIAKNSPESIKEAVKSFFKDQFGGQEELLDELNPSILDQFLNIFKSE